MGMIMTSPPPANYLYYSGLMLVLMYGYGFVRLRFIWASLSGWLLVIVYEIIAWSFTSTEHKILISNTFFLVTANFIGMVGCYTIERNQRKGFYLAHQLRQEQNNVVSANSMLEQRVADRTAELASANQALERQVNERKLQEEQTRQAQKMESIGLLAGGVAHDFNNILTIILGNAGLLTLRDLSAEEIANHVGAITKSAKRGAQLVGQLLTFARKNETNYSHININDVAGDIAGLLEGTFPKNIAIRFASFKRAAVYLRRQRANASGADEHLHQCARRNAVGRNAHGDDQDLSRKPRAHVFPESFGGALRGN